MTGFLRGSRFSERTSTAGIRIRRPSGAVENLDVEHAYHALARGSAELEDPNDVEALRLLEETGQRLLERQARDLTRDGLLS